MTTNTAHESSTSQAEPTSFALMLKRGTQDLHDQAEAGPFQRRMVDGALRRAEFVALLQQVRHVHAALEPVLRDAATRDHRLAGMLREEHFRLDKIDRDLRDLDASSDAPALPATRSFIEFVQKAGREAPLSLIGVLYVKEGATNGNKIVAKRLREALELPEACAMGYLDPHGPDQRRRWNDFKAGLDALALDEDERARCLEAARSTFRLFMDVSAQITGVFESA